MKIALHSLLFVSLLATFITHATALAAQEPVASFSAATIDAQGFWRHEVRSQYQAGTTTIRVLLPDSAARCRGRYRVLFVLPVEPGEGQRYGDGLAEIKRLNLHSRYQLICVQPTFSHLPWYADHPSDPHIRQETYLVNVVLPFIQTRYAVKTGCENCLLLGFSKSGWGAWSLLLRHPEMFGRAAAWDAPLAMTEPNRYGMKPIFGTQENFERYEILASSEHNASWLRCSTRLGLFGYGNFREQIETVHSHLVALGIPYCYRDGPWREHTWTSGWIPEAVEFLASRCELATCHADGLRQGGCRLRRPGWRCRR